ncbi:hypothetical protein [uncultured Endozoicomonas sp.]|uniref:hypothetical protein n=1 Tax=uncultured Endozoicomonas sp. TaxID=432652 RepID=UPI0026149989|nr:hypothetical protein [uncultured Endozoicomonas sp.]
MDELERYNLISLLFDARQLFIDESLRLDQQAVNTDSALLQRNLKKQANRYRRKADDAGRIKALMEQEFKQALRAH